MLRADYLPPTVALVGRRRLHLGDSRTSDREIPSPIALQPPSGLEALADFDVYIDLKHICRVLQRTTTAILSGDIKSYIATEVKLKSQLHDLAALGTSISAWGRRSEILKCVHLGSLIYLKALSRQKSSAISDAFLRLVGSRLSRLEPLVRRHLHGLLETLVRGVLADDKRIATSVGPLMKVGASMSMPSWIETRELLREACEEIYRQPLPLVTEISLDSRAVDISGLTALFGFFNLSQDEI